MVVIRWLRRFTMIRLVMTNGYINDNNGGGSRGCGGRELMVRFEIDMMVVF